MVDAHDAADLLYALQGLSLARNLPIPKALVGLTVFTPFIDEIRQDRALFLLSLIPQPNDGNKDPYVASVGGGILWDGGDIIAAGDDIMEKATARAILEYARRCWHFDW